MKVQVQYSKLVEHIDSVSIFMCTISVLIGVINLFAKFLTPLFYNLIVSTFALSVIGFTISDLYSIISQKNRKPATIGSTSILKQVLAVIIFYLCSVGFALFLFFGFFGYTEQSFYLSIMFSSGISYFGHYREHTIAKNNKTKIEKVNPIDLSFLFQPKLMYSALYFSIAFLIITLINKHIVPLSPSAPHVIYLTGVFYGVIFGTDLRYKTMLVSLGAVATCTFLILSKII
ncbi:MAG: hypothetical protein LCH20_00255 [Proteobacteria bacterium]|nr:hypothetical protein [Pseudomonadota bacterium]